MSKEVLDKQVGEWRKEIARLKDLIAHATGTQAAANKATEEGELPDHKVYAVIDSMGWDLDDNEKDDMHRLCRAAIAAGRASRQVANKAEVDLSNLKRFDVNYDQGGVFFSASEFGKYYKVSDVEVLLATPPATTGASTASVTIPDGWEPVYLVWSEQNMVWQDDGLAEWEGAAECDRRITYQPKEAN